MNAWYKVLGIDLFLSPESADEFRKYTSVDKVEGDVYYPKVETITLEQIKSVFQNARGDVSMKDFYEYI